MSDRDGSGGDFVILRVMHICCCERRVLRHSLLQRRRRRHREQRREDLTLVEDRHMVAESISLVDIHYRTLGCI